MPRLLIYQGKNEFGNQWFEVKNQIFGGGVRRAIIQTQKRNQEKRFNHYLIATKH